MKSVYGLLLFLSGVFVAGSKSPEQIISYIKITDTVQVLVPTTAEVYLLARLIESEASRSQTGVERISGRIAAGNVVMNRLRANLKSGKTVSLKKIIYKKNQFCGIKVKRFRDKPSKESLIAATIALLDLNLLPDNILFFNSPNAPNIWNKTELVEWARIAKHSFKYKS